MKREWYLMVWKKALIVGTAFSAIAASGCNASGSEQAQAAAASTAEKSVNLSDINTHWAKDAIVQAVKKGYVDGYEDGTFKPDANISRAEFTKMLVTATGTNAGSKGAQWYDAYVNAVTDAGIYHSDDDFPADKFGEPLTRVEMAKLAVRYLNNDARQQGAHLYDASAMYRACGLGIIQGLSGGELGPDQPTTRAQSVTIIERVLSVAAGNKLPVDKLALGNADLELTGSNTREYLLTPSVKLPLEYDYSDSIHVIVHRVKVVDMEDRNDPVAMKILTTDQGTLKANEAIKTKLVVGLYVTIDNKSAGFETGLDLYSTVLEIVGTGVAWDGTSLYGMDTTKVRKITGWIYYTIDKKLNANFLNGTYPFPLFFTINGKEIYLTDISKKN
ncbi:S-layer homology domain-containing protein [Gordoniibacillus kamchatkensis]|uniref:S-layer homology domain-containing protein n=1 Tax=Gordoniibacillus kamchatkensis TaxID=1590651 RepID=UPI00069621AC|nr:S-layer homology domain-containing protein [Paenibacillus sp. VKM B-2647]